MNYYFIAFLCFLLATGLISYVVFKIGYALGWKERHDDMVLPRNIVARARAAGWDGDDVPHSAIDPKKGVWH